MRILIIILALLILTTIVVGSYFVRYSLLPNSGAENRTVVTEDEIVPQEEVKQTVDLISETIEKENDQRDAWLEEMNWEDREVSITSHDGLKLYGHAFEQDSPTNNWVILLHGYQSNEYETFTMGQHFYHAGYNVLTISFRAHGKSEGKYIGMGYLDKDDLISWTNYLVNKNPESQIIYHGTSMGGATVLMASGMDLPLQVKAIVSDSAYTGIWEIFSSEMRQRFDLPSFPVLNMAQIMGTVLTGYNIKDGNVLEYVSKSTLPILFIHTDEDDFVPVSMVHELYQAKTTGDKDLYVLENGGHTMAKFVNPTEYYQTIYTFIERYL